MKIFPVLHHHDKKQKNKENEINDQDNFETLPYHWRTKRLYPQCFLPRFCLHRLLSLVFIEKLQSMLQNCPQHQKNMTPNTDAPDADAPKDADDADAYTKSIHIYLQNINCNPNIAPNTKIKHNK